MPAYKKYIGTGGMLITFFFLWTNVQTEISFNRKTKIASGETFSFYPAHLIISLTARHQERGGREEERNVPWPFPP